MFKLHRLKKKIAYNNDYNAVVTNLIARVDNVKSVPFLNLACGIASIEIVRDLLMRGSNSNLIHQTLIVAARSGDIDIARLLLDWNQDTIPIVIVNREFIAAATRDALDVVKVFAADGPTAYTTALSAITRTDFQVADSRGRPIWQGLCERCVYPDYHPHRSIPMQYHSMFPLVKLYLEFKADADMILARSGNTVLLACCSSSEDSYYEFAWLQLEHGANVNLAHPTTDETPLMRAALAARTDLIRLFLNYGTDVMQVNVAGQSTLDLMGTRPKYAKVVAMFAALLHNKLILMWVSPQFTDTYTGPISDQTN